MSWSATSHERASQPSRQAPTQDDPDAPPRVWAILEDRAGDDAQLMNLVDALGWPTVFKKPLYTLPEVVRHRLAGTPRRFRQRPDPFVPPWPDLVLTVGGRSVAAARHIRTASGGRTRVVCLGRPWAPLDWFDLVVTTPQYRLPERSNVLQNLLPFNRPPGVGSSREHERWRTRLATLPQPHIAVLVGGNNGTYVLNRRSAQELGRRASDLAGQLGGSLLVSTSPRTPAAAAEALQASLTAPNVCYLWHQHDGAGNPYPVFVHAAGHLIVTGDSASMLAEACGAEGRVHLFDLPESLRTRVMSRLFPIPSNVRGTESATQSLTARGLWFPRKDLTRIHDHLTGSGRVTRLGEVAAAVDNVSDIAVTVRRIRQLMGRPEATAPAAEAVPRQATR